MDKNGPPPPPGFAPPPPYMDGQQYGQPPYGPNQQPPVAGTRKN